jgi:hypothetical protein
MQEDYHQNYHLSHTAANMSHHYQATAFQSHQHPTSSSIISNHATNTADIGFGINTDRYHHHHQLQLQGDEFEQYINQDPLDDTTTAFHPAASTATSTSPSSNPASALLVASASTSAPSASYIQHLENQFTNAHDVGTPPSETAINQQQHLPYHGSSSSIVQQQPVQQSIHNPHPSAMNAIPSSPDKAHQHHHHHQLIQQQQHQPQLQTPQSTSTAIPVEGQTPDPVASQKVLMWQNGIAYPTESLSSVPLHQQSQYRVQSSSTASAIPATYSNTAPYLRHVVSDQGGSLSSPSGGLSSVLARAYLDASRDLLRSPPSAHTHFSSGSSRTTNKKDKNDSNQYATIPAVQSAPPHTLHFHPPPQAIISFPLNQPGPVPVPIDLNPSASISRHHSMDMSFLRRDSSSSSSNITQHLSQQVFGGNSPPTNSGARQIQQQQQQPLNSVPSIQSTTAATFRTPNSNYWDDPATPARNIHARFQSASNVRGAPTEAFEGSPAKFSWDPHGRMTTMDSIASSQWVSQFSFKLFLFTLADFSHLLQLNNQSPVINDMYRFIDPLRPNFEMVNSADPSTSISSPVRNLSDLELASDVDLTGATRVCSVISIPPEFAASPPRVAGTVIQAPTPVRGESYKQPPSVFRQPLGQQSTTSHNEQPLYPHLRQSSQALGQQSQQHKPSLDDTRLPSIGGDGPLELEDDTESRRASTSTTTTTSSLPLVSPPDLQTSLPNITQHVQASESHPYACNSSSTPYYPQDTKIQGGKYGYRDYFAEQVHGSPASIVNPLALGDYLGNKIISPYPAGSLLFRDDSQRQTEPSSHKQWHNTATVDIPTVQMHRHTLNDNVPVRPEVTEQKRKRGPSLIGSLAAVDVGQASSSAIGRRSHSANETLAPSTGGRAYRRLSSPVLSVRPNELGDGGTLSDGDDDDDDNNDQEASENITQTSAHFSNISGGLYGSYPGSHNGFLQLPTVGSSSSGPLPGGHYASSSSVPSSSTSGSASQTPAESQPAHPAPPVPSTAHLVRTLPSDEDDPELGKPRRQKLRFAGDFYTPEWVRGEAAKKEGFCDLCQPGKWLQLKNSAFW